MARAGVVVAVTAMLIGSTGAGVLAGAVLVAGGLWAFTAMDNRVALPKTEIEYATASSVPATSQASSVEAAAPVVATPAHATPVTTSTPKPSTTPSGSTRSSGTSTTTRSPKPAPKPAATSSGDLLADEDEWEAMGFEDAPDVAPGTPTAEEPVNDDELDEILEDLDADPKPRRGR